MRSLETSIFGKSLKEVTFEDIVLFCEKQIPEGINLDYKKDLSNSKKIVRAVASFANTRGGYVIIGIEDVDDKPVQPPVGMDYTDQLSLSITNMIISQMDPPFIPTIHVCPPVKGKTFVVIYTPESHDSPHWLFNKKELYIRVSERTDSGDWERFATADEWEWLRNKREKSVSLRETLKEQMDDIFFEYRWRDELDQRSGSSTSYSATSLPDTFRTSDLLSMSISPSFPNNKLATIDEIYNLTQEISIHDYYGTGETFPAFISHRTVFENGSYIFWPFQEKRYYFAGINCNGIFIFKETTVFTEDLLDAFHEGRDKTVSYIELTRLIARIDQFLSVAASLYSKLDYFGSLHLNLHIEGDNWMIIKIPSDRISISHYENPTGVLNWEDSLTVDILTNTQQRYELIQRIIKDLMYGFGWKDFNQQFVSNYLLRSDRYKEIIQPQ